LSSGGEQKVDASSKVANKAADTVSRLLESNLVVLIPLTAFVLYGLHPVIGLLTATSALSFKTAARRLEQEEKQGQQQNSQQQFRNT